MTNQDELNKKLFASFNESLESQEADCLPPVYEELSEVHQRYDEGSFIDQGGMKSIFKVYDKITKRHIAMAQLSESHTQELYDPFIREARLTALLTHPNIIPIYDIGINKKGTPFFTMELKEGDSLQKIIDSCAKDDRAYLQRYSLEILLGIFIKVCDAMAYAHSNKVIHLDLKPENIQVGRFGEVLICDWGLGKVLGTPTIDNFDQLLFNPDFLNNATLHGTIKGTPGFMAPEQISKEGEKDQQTDIYVLGCMLFSLLTYQAPFTGKTDDILKKTLSGDFSFPLNNQLPEGLKAIVTKAMQTEADERYLLVEHMRDDVQKYLLGFAPSAENAGFGRQLKLFYQRNKVQSLSAISFTILLAIFTTIFFINIENRRQEAESARVLAEEKQQEAANEKRRAEDALRIVQTEKRRAKEALKLYRGERKWRETILSDHRDLLENDVLDYLFYSSLDKDPAEHMARTFTYLDRLIEAYPKRNELYAKRARAHFMMQNFNSAVKDFNAAQSTHSKNVELQKLSEKYAPLVPDDQEIPSQLLPQFIQDLADLRDHYVQYKVFNCFLIKKRSTSQTAEYVQLILKSNNPAWNPQSFQYDSERKSLSLSGQGLTTIGYSFGNRITGKQVIHNTYDFLPMRHLSIYDMEQFPKYFFGSSVQNLDISQSKVIPTQDLLKMKNLKKLTLSPEQASIIDALKKNEILE
jgi:serine/threonine protein kinase